MKFGILRSNLNDKKKNNPNNKCYKAGSLSALHKLNLVLVNINVLYLSSLRFSVEVHM